MVCILRRGGHLKIMNLSQKHDDHVVRIHDVGLCSSQKKPVLRRVAVLLKINAAATAHTQNN